MCFIYDGLIWCIFSVWLCERYEITCVHVLWKGNGCIVDDYVLRCGIYVFM